MTSGALTAVNVVTTAQFARRWTDVIVGTAVASPAIHLTTSICVAGKVSRYCCMLLLDGPLVKCI